MPERKPKTVGIVANHQQTAVVAVLKSLANFLAEQKVRVLGEKSTAAVCGRGLVRPDRVEKVVQQADFVVVLGGDGTLLHAARFAAPLAKPLLGINLGRLGYITPIAVSEVLKATDLALKGKLRVEERMMLNAQIVRRGQVKAKFLALNDIVITKAATGRIVELETFIDGAFLTSYRADGLIVSTPTGSTAYVLAVGGPILHPRLKNLVLTPIAPHTLSHRPLVLSDTSKIEVVIPEGRPPILITADGQPGLNLHSQDRIVIEKSKETTRLLLLKSFNYWEILRTKLGWRG